MDFKFKEKKKKKIIYQFADGTQNEVEVSDEFYAQYQEIEKEEKNKNRAETRRHISLSQMQENGFEPILQESSLEEDLLKEEMKKELLEAISTLTPEQQDLVYKVFYENKSTSQVAKEMGALDSSISHKLERIYKKLKKFWQ